jgi:hypothetical protein
MMTYSNETMNEKQKYVQRVDTEMGSEDLASLEKDLKSTQRLTQSLMKEMSLQGTWRERGEGRILL